MHLWGCPVPSQPSDSSSLSLERKLATILSADVAEFSRLMSEDEEQTLRTFRGHKEVFESLVVMHRGRVFNTAGDAILAEFSSAVEAVRCATDIQTALRTRNDRLPLERQVRFRIGVNLGDVMVQGQDLLGDGVNVAARLQTAAEPGGVCISGSVHDQIRNKLSLTFLSLGERTYKNIAQPVRTFSVMEAETGAQLPASKPSGSGRATAFAIAAAVVALLLAGGYWAYIGKEAGRSQTAQIPAVASPATAQPSVAGSQAGQAPQPPRAAGSVAAPSSAPAAESTAAPSKTAPSTKVAPSAGPASVPSATVSAGV